MVANASSKSADLDTGIGSTMRPKRGAVSSCLPLEGDKRGDVMGVVDDAYALDRGIELFEQLKDLAVDIFHLVHHAGDVATGPRERGDGGHGAHSDRVRGRP